MRRSVALVALCLAASLGLAGTASASPVSSLTLSDLSSEENGSSCEPNCNNIPLASQLDATLTFSVVDNAGDLDVTLTLSNDTPDFKINEVYFNLSGISSLTAVNLNGWNFFADACPPGSPTTGIAPCNDMGGSSTKADGFGIYDVALKTNGGNALNPLDSIAFTVTVLGGAGTMAEAFTTELSRQSEAGGNILGLAAAKFIEGPQVMCPDAENICDSGFGMVVPEPATAAMVTLGLVGLGYAGRRRR